MDWRNNTQFLEGYFKTSFNSFWDFVFIIYHFLAFLLRIQREMKYGLHKPRVRTGKIKANHKNRFVCLKYSWIDATAHSSWKDISKHLFNSFWDFVCIIYLFLAFLLRIQREMKYGSHKQRVRTGKIKANYKNTVNPQKRPAGLILFQRLQLRVLLEFWPNFALFTYCFLSLLRVLLECGSYSRAGLFRGFTVYLQSSLHNWTDTQNHRIKFFR